MSALTDDPAISGARVGAFEHVGLLYDGAEDYLAGVLPFVYDALAAGRPVLVAVPHANLGPLRTVLAAVPGVHYVDMTLAGRNPGRILPGVLLAFADAHPGRRVTVIGESVWPGRSRPEHSACVLHEAMVNMVFAGRDALIVCPYDVRLGAPALTGAQRTHPVMMREGSRLPNPRYDDPLTMIDELNLPLTPAPAHAAAITYHDDACLAEVRRFTAEQAAAIGLRPDRVQELVLAVNELATNTMEHTSAGGRLSMWSEQRMLVCQVDDHGHMADPLVGRVRPAGARGHGLMVVNQLCDLVRVHSRRGRTMIRLHMLI
ncbi:anti-sigma factor RsbA family regulatory protein [Planomonospora corallina]|uniref:Anti-sigma factor RsbA family regulatory protein n=1 Tax=Planomonospora corallina TaxID=1806052 RepID=A0ABV8I456_9ACTN